MSCWPHTRYATILLIALSAAPAAAGEPGAAPQERAGRATAAPGPASRPGGLSAADEPPAPEPPEVITRDDRGHATIRAVRVAEPLKIDGRLDEEVYGAVSAVGDFIQQEPQAGEPETERTETWVLFDNENLYVSARLWDDHPERWVITEMRRDQGNIIQNENFSVTLDTFHDRRNGFLFQTTPLGAVRDGAFADEGNFNGNWNTVWAVKSGRFDGGWTVEMAIPFKSLRYRGAGPQVWGISFRRIVKWKNEVTYLTRVPPAYGNNGVFRMSVAGTLVGLETPGQSLNLELKPYLVSSVTTDRAAASPFSNRLSRSAGFDFKYGLTRGLIADATYNTDFAQVEEDVQQVNLTRFSLLFPEKRDFFLEGQGIFSFGGVGGGGQGGGVPGGGPNDVPVLFFSRRIGLSQGQAVPVVAGGRLAGTVGKFGVGALNIETDDQLSAGAVATNFSVIRLKRDVLRRSNIGVLATRRTPTVANNGSNVALGADANFAFFRDLTIHGYYARTQAPGASGNRSSYRGRFDYAGDRYGFQVDHILVGDRFTPEIGFVRRADFRRSTIAARFSPRLKSSRLIRKLNWNGSYDYITDGKRTRVENRQASANFRVDLHNSDEWVLDYTRDFEYLPKNFQIASNVLLPIGGYNYETVRTTYTFGQQHRIGGRLSVATGTFYEGHKQEVTFNAGRVKLSTRFNIEPGMTLDWIDLPQGRFTTNLITARGIFTPSARSLISSLFQYNQTDHTLSSSVRLRWEYTGGSELFVVYSDGRALSEANVPGLLNRSIAVKITRLVRF